jgi:hypothetical protein
MRRLLVIAAVLIALPVVHAFAQATHAGSHENGAAADAVNGDLDNMILALETKRIEAMVKKDLVTLDALLADDLTYTHSGGTIDTKASFITLIKERGRYLGVDYTEKQVIRLGASTVIVRGIAQIRLKDTPAYPVLFLDVWALRGGTWKMVAWQATRPRP